VRSTGVTEAVIDEEFAVTATVRFPVTAAVPVTLIARGFGEQVTPGGKVVPDGQVIFTMPVKPPLGVTVIVDIALLPAVTVVAAPLTVNDPVVVPPIVPEKEKFRMLLPPNA
jgi:hypothetical protein